MKTIIIEDNPTSYERILKLLGTFPELKVIDVGPISSVEIAKQAITEHNPDLILLDNNLDPQGWREEAEGLIIGLFAKEFNPSVTIVSISDLKIPDSQHHIDLLSYYHRNGLVLTYYAGKDDHEIALAIKQIVIARRKIDDQSPIPSDLDIVHLPEAKPNYDNDIFCFLVSAVWFPYLNAQLWNINHSYSSKSVLKVYTELIDHVYKHKNKKIINFEIVASNAADYSLYFDVFHKGRGFNYLAEQITYINDFSKSLTEGIIKAYKNLNQ
ncbi:MAG TPA: hypothetical protein PLP46_02495 [bacterium]|nr:hypothetical protein [bacterium]